MTADQIGGEYVWYVPDGYYPETSTGDFPSHEALCVLNTNEEDAHITIELYFEDREPMGGFEVLCKGKRTQHISCLLYTSWRRKTAGQSISL